jgi:hypothetical protein
MKDADPRFPAIGSTPAEFRDISPLDEQVLARARRQRANELAKLAGLAATKVAGGVAAIYRWLTRARLASRNFG